MIPLKKILLCGILVLIILLSLFFPSLTQASGVVTKKRSMEHQREAVRQQIIQRQVQTREAAIRQQKEAVRQQIIQRQVQAREAAIRQQKEAVLQRRLEEQKFQEAVVRRRQEIARQEILQKKQEVYKQTVEKTLQQAMQERVKAQALSYQKAVQERLKQRELLARQVALHQKALAQKQLTQEAAVRQKALIEQKLAQKLASEEKDLIQHRIEQQRVIQRVNQLDQFKDFQKVVQEKIVNKQKNQAVQAATMVAAKRGEAQVLQEKQLFKQRQGAAAAAAAKVYQSVPERIERNFNVGDKINEAEVQQVVDIQEVWDSLNTSSEVWPLIMEVRPKAVTVAKYIDEYNREGARIEKPAMYYVSFIDGMLADNPSFQNLPLKEVLKIGAIAEYDFNNGQDKDTLARKVLGDSFYKKNKQRVSGNSSSNQKSILVK